MQHLIRFCTVYLGLSVPVLRLNTVIHHYFADRFGVVETKIGGVIGHCFMNEHLKLLRNLDDEMV